MTSPERSVLKMIAELHVRGYQRLRIVPHIYSLGTWRCGITPASNVRPDHGAIAVSWAAELLVQHTSANGNKYFGWEDAKQTTPSGLARRFIERFPRIAEAGYGPDWEYAGWYTHLLHQTYPDAVPYAFHDYAPVTWFLYTNVDTIRIPLPPAGWATRVDLVNYDGPVMNLASAESGVDGA